MGTWKTPHEDDGRDSGDGSAAKKRQRLLACLPLDALREAQSTLSLTASEGTSFAHTLFLDF